MPPERRDTAATFDVRDHDVCCSVSLHPEFAIDALCWRVEAVCFFDDEFYRCGRVIGSGFQEFVLNGRDIAFSTGMELPQHIGNQGGICE